ncbi:MAG: Inositol 2-dehydrogenase [Verrucomicrobiota bacterium]
MRRSRGVSVGMTDRPISLMPRRKFLVTGAAALGLAPMAFLRAQQGAANDEIAVGLVGCGGQGSGVMNNFLNIQGIRVVAVCDVDANNMKGAKARVDGHYKNQDCKSYPHYGALLQHPGLDAIIIGTPDHMHASIGIAAAKAGKHVYGEKPFTWGLREGRLLNDALTKNKCVWQTGSMQRSGGEFRRFRALIQNHTVGKITRVECGTPGGMSIHNHIPEAQWPEMIGKPPAHLDWAGWCGPVKDFPYHPMLHPWNWRWHSSFGGGQLLDWVGHHVDIALWSLGLDRTGPVKMEGSGELGDHKFFDTYVKYAYQGTFEDGRVVEVRSDFMGTKITGENGWIHVDRGRLEASDREMLRNVPADFDSKPPNHAQDFVNCVRERRFNTASDPEGSHRSSSFGQLAIVAMDTKQPVKWDPKAEAVLDNPVQAKHPRLVGRPV